MPLFSSDSLIFKHVIFYLLILLFICVFLYVCLYVCEDIKDIEEVQ